MGWTCTHKDVGLSLDEFFEEELQDDIFKFVGKSYSKGNTYYRAMKDTRSNEVFCMVVLVRYTHKSYYNFEYKDMTDNMGPCEANCPNYILDLLTPTDNSYANKWREVCRKHNERKSAIKVGAVLRFKTALRFNNGLSVTVIEVCDRIIKGRHYKGFKAITDTGSSFFVRIPNIQQYDFEVVQSA